MFTLLSICIPKRSFTLEFADGREFGWVQFVDSVAVDGVVNAAAAAAKYGDRCSGGVRASYERTRRD